MEKPQVSFPSQQAPLAGDPGSRTWGTHVSDPFHILAVLTNDTQHRYIGRGFHTHVQISNARELQFALRFGTA